MSTIRPARPDDLEALVGLLGELFRIEADFDCDPACQRRGLELLLQRPEAAHVAVAEQEGQVVGMATVQLLISTAEGGPVGLVEDVVVGAAARGGGLGRRLLEALERWTVERGGSRLQLLADRDNRPALLFYERLEWQPTALVALRRPLVNVRH